MLFVLLLALPAVARAEWEQREIHGRGYVSIPSIKENYHFNEMKTTGKRVVIQRVDPKSGKAITNITFNLGATECLMNGMKFVFSYPVATAAGKAWVSRIDLAKLIHPVLSPNFIKDAGDFKTVIIDPGHGGQDLGATNPLGHESRYNLQVAKYLKAILEKGGYKVVMTRSDDHFLTLQQRVQVANNVQENAIFISIHHNSASSRARGIETFTLSPVGVAHYGRGLKQSDYHSVAGNSHDSANVALATAVHGMIYSTYCSDKKGNFYSTLDRGIKRARFSVLSGVRHPAILVECGFLTNPSEAKWINNSQSRQNIAKLIAGAIARYKFAVSRGAKAQR
ncbi:N-acetylmuramoyl-L-alanine amidase family protein [Haloferula sargassicola]|uniref:N-acetylmuramoyl-L-alanine amidase n=1 Tax=Haloferula sargassicola TaxID=490096 RepID=A0ABP9UWH2_9BACT